MENLVYLVMGTALFGGLGVFFLFFMLRNQEADLKQRYTRDNATEDDFDSADIDAQLKT